MMGRFCRYIQKVFDFGALVAGIRDGRVQPRIPLCSIWMSVLGMFGARLGSLNALESQLRSSDRWERLVGASKPSAEAVGYCLARIDPESLRCMLKLIVRRLARNKALDPSPWTVRAVAFDGHEFFSLTTSSLPGLL